MRPKDTLRLPAKQRAILARDSNKILQKFELLKDDPEFQKDVKSLRSKWDIEPGQQKLVVSARDDLGPILKKHHLGKEWSYILRIYVITGEVETIGDPHGIQVDFTKQMTSATLKIYPETSLRELKQVYSYLQKKWKSGKSIRTRTASNADRDQYIYKLRMDGKGYKVIADLVWENYGERLDPGHLKAIVSKIKVRKSKLR